MTRAWLFKLGLRYNPAGVSAKLSSDMKYLKSKHFYLVVHYFLIGFSKKRENYLRKSLWTEEKEAEINI